MFVGIGHRKILSNLIAQTLIQETFSFDAPNKKNIFLYLSLDYQ